VGLRGGGALVCARWQVGLTLCDSVWQVALRTSAMGFDHRRR